MLPTLACASRTSVMRVATLQRPHHQVLGDAVFFLTKQVRGSIFIQIPDNRALDFLTYKRIPTHLLECAGKDILYISHCVAIVVRLLPRHLVSRKHRMSGVAQAC
jgi:hypothetical protein